MDEQPQNKTSLDTLVSQLSKPSPSAPPSGPAFSAPSMSRPTAPPTPPQPPPGLPTKPPVVPGASPSQTSGIMGAVPRPVAPPGQPAQPPRPSTPPSPTPAAPAQSGQPTEYQTSLRTMAGDVSKVKVGQTPSGTDIKKTITEQKPALAPTIPPPPTIKPSPLQPPTPRIASPAPILPSSPISPIPPRQTPPQITIPPEIPKRSNSRLFILIAVGALVIGATYWYLSSTEEPEVVLSPTPSETQEPTPPPENDLQSYFGTDTASIELTNTPNPGVEFSTQLSAVPLDGGQTKKLSITSVAKGSAEYTVTDLLDRFLVNYPPQLLDDLAEDGIILAYGQREVFDVNGKLLTDSLIQTRLVLVSEIGETTAENITDTMREWEATMTEGLESLFGYNKARSTPKTFADNFYQGTDLRFKNFAWPDRSIDYGLVNASNGRTYLLISNSRESAFAAIDRLLGR